MRHNLIRRAYIKNVFSPNSTIMAFQLIDPIKQPILGVIKQMYYEFGDLSYFKKRKGLNFGRNCDDILIVIYHYINQKAFFNFLI